MPEAVRAVHEHLGEIRRMCEGLFSDEIPPESIPDEVVQQLLAAGIRTFYAKRCVGSELAPLSKEQVTASEVLETVQAILRAVNLENFELNMWSSWGKPS